MTLTGCGTTTDTAVTSAPNFPLCADPETGRDGLLSPIRWSSDDTDETIRQAKAHNRLYDEFCGKDR